MVGVFEMVESRTQNLQSLSDQIDKLSKEQQITRNLPESPKTDVVLFFSFDVVNSTLYKTIDYYGWAQVLNLLFKELRKEVQKEINSSEMWRVLGDEAIFIVKIRDEQLLRVYINKIFNIMISTIYKLKSGRFFTSDQSCNFKKPQSILSLKTTAWIAAVKDVGEISNDVILSDDTYNIFECYDSQEGHKIYEFLGNDIDTGFRIAKETLDGRMVLSYELAYLLSQETQGLSNLHIITYRRLKGVWNDKLYPIIWYHNPKAYADLYKKEITFTESFPFDACDESDLIREYYDNRNPDSDVRIIRDSRMYTDPYYAFNKILQDRCLTEKVEHLQHLIKDAIQDQTQYIDTELMQIHCVAVCFKEFEDGIKILIAKRQGFREKHKGEWEFGCAKAVINKSIAERIKEEYWQDFNIRIEPVLDETRQIREPIPIALYQVSHGSHIHDAEKKDKGIITLARITDEFNPADFNATDKHEKLEWITESDLPDIQTRFEKTVPDFEQTLREAFAKIKSLSMENA